MVLSKLLVPGRLAGLESGGARPFCACDGCGWGLFGRLFSHLSFLFFLPL